MRKAFLTFLILPFLSQAATMAVGGFIRPVNSLHCLGGAAMDFSRDGENVLVATCWVTSNAPWFQASFRFDPEVFDPGSGAGPVAIHSLTVQGGEGLLGRGLQPPRGEEILPLPEPGTFTWEPGEQGSATVDYALEFRASWKAAMPVPPLSALRIRTDLASAL